jgi:hypothetical protein
MTLRLRTRTGRRAGVSFSSWLRCEKRSKSSWPILPRRFYRRKSTRTFYHNFSPFILHSFHRFKTHFWTMQPLWSHVCLVSVVRAQYFFRFSSEWADDVNEDDDKVDYEVDSDDEEWISNVNTRIFASCIADVCKENGITYDVVYGYVEQLIATQKCRLTMQRFQTRKFRHFLDSPQGRNSTAYQVKYD